MKKSLLVGFVAVAQLMSCSPDNTPSVSVIKPVPVNPTTTLPNENVSALFQQFHGKYKVISSVTSEPVDVNLDGISSVNLLQEMDELSLQGGTQYHTELKIYGPSPSSAKPSFTFIQWWPEQFIRTGVGKVWDGGELLSYNPDYVVKYDFQSAYRSFSLSNDLKKITVNPDAPNDAYRWVRPESVTVEDNERLRVTNKRRLYTRLGVKEVTITTVYQRFTTS